MTSRKDFMLPCPSSRLIPNRVIAAAILSDGFAMFVNMVRSDVPAELALIPAFAIRPRAMETSSALYPIAPATGATYLKDSPSIETFVFALLDAAARTSAKWDESSAASPKAVSASVTMSDVVPSSSPDAAARFMIPETPFSMSSVFQPAIAMYSYACAASVVLNFVFLPSSFAFSDSRSMSSAVAPEMACTLDISSLKSAVTFVE